MFRNAKLGDRVWCFRLGWGEVIKIIHNDTYPLQVRSENGKLATYTDDGRIFIDESATLFWDEIKYEIPTKPKRMVTKTIEVWVNVYTKPATYNRSLNYFIHEDHANEFADDNRTACVKLTGTYEVEED
jgi:hypothetical protein